MIAEPKAPLNSDLILIRDTRCRLLENTVEKDSQDRYHAANQYTELYK